MDELPSPFTPVCPFRAGERQRWGRLYGSSPGLVISNAVLLHDGPVIVITPDTPSAQQLEYALRFYIGDAKFTTLSFPDWETLPYDVFSPHQDIISERLATLYHLPTLDKGLLIVPVQTLMHRITPSDYLTANSLIVDKGQTLDLKNLPERLQDSGYSHVSSVMEHGEFALRGSLIDLFPMGSRHPFRIELFDDEVESIRTFDPESQRSLNKVDHIRLLPAREFPLNKEAIKHFRQHYRTQFEGDPQSSTIYRDVSNSLAPSGIEYYLALFFEQTQTLFDYLPDKSLIICLQEVESAADAFWEAICQRYEQGRHDVQRPLLPPTHVFLQAHEIFAHLKHYPQVTLQKFEYVDDNASNFATNAPPKLILDVRAIQPTHVLRTFVDGFDGRILFVAETAGRKEILLELLRGCDLHPTSFTTWQEFITNNEAKFGMTIAPLEHGLLLDEPKIAVITEPQLFGQQVMQRRRRKVQRDIDSMIRNLAELLPGVPVVHEDYGVGRYLGLEILNVGDMETEFLALAYAGGDKLYVPVSSLHLISRYTGAAPESAPLHKLGSGQWERAKRKASERIHDVAAELLEIYARRQARSGFSYPMDETQYRAFCASFPFEETPDQQTAIDNVLNNMQNDKPMDQLICGDVGFGKTEVAMRAAFIAIQADKQVAILVPTTLLSQQHLDNFRDRFADWPVHIESLSRFRSKKEQTQIIARLKEGTIDIIIGTHRLLQEDIQYKRLGLVIIDEEHRFGVRQKERFKALRSEIDILTLTATPIPRTLNMSLSGIRDLSIIATPPARRLTIKTFVSQWNNGLIQEACLREIKRGGQVYFLHNEVETISTQAKKLQELVPEATVHFAHGQMRERELEQVMTDFYHQRFNILVCTTIIESGIDIPSANTIIINRADHFGLAQLYQLRGRVGRSHHRAYAYLIIPSRKRITADAQKRLEAIESIESLGTGFTLATHDLEIRGAGELLGDEQSGQLHEIGFTLYTELLERAVKALKSGQIPELDKPLQHGSEVNLHTPALIPEDYLPDIHQRLILYKRIASAKSFQELRDLQVEMIDRFGLLPKPTTMLFNITQLKLSATPLGISKIELGARGGYIQFIPQPNIDPAQIIQLIQTKSSVYKLDSNEKLRITMDLPNAENRIKELENLLVTLSVQNAA